MAPSRSSSLRQVPRIEHCMLPPIVHSIRRWPGVGTQAEDVVSSPLGGLGGLWPVITIAVRCAGGGDGTFLTI